MGPPRCGRLFFAFVRPPQPLRAAAGVCGKKEHGRNLKRLLSLSLNDSRSSPIVSRCFRVSPGASRLSVRAGFGDAAPRPRTFSWVLGGSPPERVRAISIARLRASPPAHLRPIDVVVSHGPGNGDLILRGASCLDAFSTYPGRRRLPGGAAGATTGAPVLRPTRSSRTSVGASQVSRAHNR